ncbi:MAG: helix-turn-helix domain-containing protein [Myxococcales bacterium]|nr:helix-turn-helix domain-containing protein [Myxococcales bacterium]
MASQHQQNPQAIVVMTQAELLALVRTAVREELASTRSESDPIDVCEALPLSRRVVLGLCRAGKIQGARKVGKRWLARREDVERFLATVPARRVKVSPANDEPWSASAALSRAGVRGQ